MWKDALRPNRKKVGCIHAGFAIDNMGASYGNCVFVWVSVSSAVAGWQRYEIEGNQRWRSHQDVARGEVGGGRDTYCTTGTNGGRGSLRPTLRSEHLSVLVGTRTKILVKVRDQKAGEEGYKVPQGRQLKDFDSACGRGRVIGSCGSRCRGQRRWQRPLRSVSLSRGTAKKENS